MKAQTTLLPIILFLFISFSHASTVAIVDSGVDYKHTDLAAQMWTNAGETPGNLRDEDGNGYPDDFYGWNFAESNSDIIDYKYLGTFSKDPYRFFEIQKKIFEGTATADEISWAKAQTKNPKFLMEVQKFGNFIHGTHVAGIAAKGVPGNKIMGLKLIPTEVKPFIHRARVLGMQAFAAGIRDGLIKGLITELSKQQGVLFKEMGEYLNNHSVEVANGSFGTGIGQAKAIVTPLFMGLWWRKPTAAELETYSKFFLEAMVVGGESFVDAAPDTLFVFAAGNDGSDNDQFPASPASVERDNVISVAATMDRKLLAKFSNYGEDRVDVAAPGVIIRSTIPGDQYMEVSGTSQAAPYVARIAGRLRSINKNLKPAQIKEIIMQTVDTKIFLSKKVKSEGIVNSQRAELAANLSKTMPIVDSIKKAQISVKDVPLTISGEGHSLRDSSTQFVFPLPSTLSF